MKNDRLQEDSMLELGAARRHLLKLQDEARFVEARLAYLNEKIERAKARLNAACHQTAGHFLGVAK